MAIEWDTDRTELDEFNREYAAELAAEREAEANSAYEFKMVPDRYSDDRLTLDEMGPMRGSANAAQYLRKLDTVERRSRAVSEAHTLTNIIGGRYSGNVASAVASLLKLIADGREDQPLYGEKFARDAREAEAELRRVTGNPNAIHNPFRP